MAPLVETRGKGEKGGGGSHGGILISILGVAGIIIGIKNYGDGDGK